MISLETPAALLLFFTVPPLVYLLHFRRHRGGSLLFSYRVWRKNGFNPKITIGRLGFLLTRFIFWIGFIFLILAAADPVTVKRERVYLTRGIDIFIVLDESPSMLAQDMGSIHRFDAAKQVIRQFVQGRANDPIGLIGFSDEAVLRVPPTVDYDRLLDSLDFLEIAGLGDGTAIGMGVSLAGYHLSSSEAPGKVIILLTDGENNAGEVEPETASELARELGIRIYTIGMGKEGEAYMELKDPDTGKIIKGRYQGRFDERLLRLMADISGGRYYHAGSPSTLSAVFFQIDTIEKTEKRTRVIVKKVSHFRRLLLTGLLLILADFVIRKAVLREVH